MERIRALAGSRWFPPSLFLIFFVFGTWPTWLALADRWLKFDESYSHGFLLMAVSLFLSVFTWRRRRPSPGFYWPWLLPLAVAAVVHAAGSVLMVNTFQELALIPILIGGLLVIWGWRQTRSFFVPVGLMIFTLPLWDYLSWPLQLVTVAVNHFMLSWFDIEFIVEGVFVYFPGIGAFEIAQGCSGLRYFLVGMTLAVLYGELNLKRIRSKIVLFLAAVFLALAANWIRVFIIIYMGYETNMTSSLIEDHDMFGWWVFAASLIPLFFVARRLEKQETDSVVAQKTKSRNGAEEDPGASKALAGMAGTILPVLAIGIVSWSAMQTVARAESSDSRQHKTALVNTDSWLPLFEQTLASWKPRIESPDRLMERTFLSRDGLDGKGGADEQLFVALYSYDFQRPGSEIVSYHNRLYDSSAQLLERTFTVEGHDSSPLAGLTLKYRRSDELIHLAYGYYVEGRWETSDLEAKLAQLPGLLNARTDASLLVVGLQCDKCDAKERLGQLTPDIQARAIKYLDGLYEIGE
jgi:exosortase